MKRSLTKFGEKPARAKHSALFGRSNRGYVAGAATWPAPRAEPVQTVSRFTPVVQRESRPTGPYTVQGQKASDLEDRVYRMLLTLGWTDDTIDFQTSILGGRMPGGQVLDFVLYGPGGVFVIPVNGDHWHAFGTEADRTREEEQKAQEAMPGVKFYPLYSGDLLTDDIARLSLLKTVGRGG